MWKKVILIMMSLVIFCYGVFSNPISSEAVGTKIATKVGKKVAKEFIEDSAVNMAMDIVFNYQMSQLLSDDYVKPEEGYKAVCLPKEVGKKDTKCSKPAQVKVPKTEVEKKVLGNKIEEVLDRKTGMTGWKKFLDWFVPIFLVSGAITWIESKFDDETGDMFDDIANEALQESGNLKPLKKKNPVVVTDGEGNVIDPTRPPGEVIPVPTGDIVAPQEKLLKNIEFDFSKNGKSKSEITIPLNGLPIVNSGIVIDLAHAKEGVQENIYGQTVISVGNAFSYATGPLDNRKIFSWSSQSVRWGYYDSKRYNVQARLMRDGNQYWERTYSTMDYGDMPTLLITDSQRLKRIVIEIGKPNTFGYGNNVHYITYDGHINTFAFEFITHKDGVSNLTGDFKMTLNHSALTGIDFKARVQFFKNFTGANLTDYTPKLDDIVLDPLDYSKYKTTGGGIKVLPPTAIPITTPDGTPVRPSQDSETGWIDVGTGEGVSVDEDTLIVGDPIKTPDGIQVPGQDPIPEPTSPSPEPIDDSIGEEDLEDLSCARPKKVNLKPIGESFTHAFPFSIPWDIKRYVDSAFGNVGEERPSFDLPFLGDNVVLEIPTYFDKFVRFGSTVVLILFDISLIYLFTRWMRGGNE